MGQGGEKKSALGILIVFLFGLGVAGGSGYGLWVVIPKGLVTTSLCVRSMDIVKRTTRSRKGFSLTSKELHLQGRNQAAVFYHTLGAIFVQDGFVSQVAAGSCYRVEVEKADYEQHLSRPVATGYGRSPVQYQRGDRPKVKMYSMARGEEMLFTPFDAYGWDAIGLGLLGLFGLFLMFCAGKSVAEEM